MLIWVADVVQGRLRDWTLVGDTAENRSRLALDEVWGAG
jgi:hypothetical protein